jgi:PAS domain S-box-containing protein
MRSYILVGCGAVFLSGMEVTSPPATSDNIPLAASSCSPVLCGVPADASRASFAQEFSEFFAGLLRTDDWPARWNCGSWSEFHGWLYILSDLTIWLSYFTIPLVLWFFLRKYHDRFPFKGIVVLFILFILACGFTHLIDAIIFWWPAYRLSGLLRLFTAGISMATVIALVKNAPAILNMKSPEVLEKTIQQRTQELTEVNARLMEEIERSRMAMKELRTKEALLEKSLNELDSAPDAMIVIDEAGKICSVNRQTERIFGYRRDELIGQPVEILVPKRYHESHFHHRQKYQQAPRVRGMGAGLDLFGVRKSGQEFPVEISLSPLKSTDGLFVTASIRDVTDRKKADEKFRGLLEAAPDAMIIIDGTGSIQLVNRQAESIFGYTREELLGQRVELLIPHRFQSAHAGHRDQYFHAPKVRQMGSGLELFGVRKNGEEFPVEISLSPLDTEDGVLISAAVRDISDRRELEKHNNQLAAIVESSDDAIISKTLDSVIVSWNNGAQRLFGYTAEEIIGKKMTLLIPADLQSEEHTIIDSVLQGVAIHHYETRRLHKNQALIDVSITISPIRSRDGKIIGASVIARDISDKKRTERELHAALASSRDLYDNAPCGYLSVDSTLYLSSINMTLLNWLGYTADEVIGKLRYEDLLSDESRQIFLASFEEDFEQYKKHGYVNNLEFEFKRKNGTVFPCIVNSLAVFDDDGNFKSSRTTVFDNTARKVAETKVLQLNKELEAFTYSVSHDLRAPLRSIDGYARILEEDHAPQLDEEARAVLSTITRNAVKMGKLIDDLLELSRTGRIELSASAINMNEMVENIIAELKQQGRYTTQVVMHELLPARGDVNMLRQVWINYLSNALKYSSKEGEAMVEVGSYRADGEIHYYVKDNGVGFDPQYINKLFGVFQRLHRAQDFEGTGVGLAIVRRIIDRHGGRTWASGAVGKGSTFYFSLPG